MSDLSVAIEYDNWATEKLARFCAALSPAQLELTTPGTMGTVKATLIHLVGAKERYAAALAIYTDLAAARNPYRVPALEELAKYYERRERNYGMALEMTRSALALEDSGAMRRREQRLKTRLASPRLLEAGC